VYFALAGDMDIRIANKYRLGRKIGGGSFGDIYVGKKSFLYIESFLYIDIYVGKKSFLYIDVYVGKESFLYIDVYVGK
jgi:hypothetical protein